MVFKLVLIFFMLANFTLVQNVRSSRRDVIKILFNAMETSKLRFNHIINIETTCIKITI